LKHRRLPRHASFAALAAAFALFVAFGPAGRVAAQVPPPAPPVPNGTPAPLQGVPSATPLPSNAPIPSSSPSPGATPTPSPQPHGRRHTSTASAAPSAAPSPSATPTSPAFATLDGTWEFQLQYFDRTEYSYLVVHQVGSSSINGIWRVSGKDFPFEGTYDGRLIRMLVKRPTGDATLSGYVEGASDMVGTVSFAGAKGDPPPFTAEHRGSSRGSIFKKNP
jgi:hypothetical protein